MRKALLLFLLGPAWLASQESVHLQKNSGFTPPQELAQSKLYAHAVAVEDYTIDAMETSTIKAISSYAMDESRSIDLLLESAQNTDPLTRNGVNALVGLKYFERGAYSASESYLGQVNGMLLDKMAQAETIFKRGYMRLLEKDFESARKFFRKASQIQSPYKAPALYYLGICHFYLNEPQTSIDNFLTVQNDDRYKDLIPYYLVQIYHAQGDNAKVIAYGEKVLKTADLRFKNEIHRILGIVYLEKAVYDKALHHLDTYASTTEKLTKEMFYQIGITHYNLGHTDKAAPYFRELQNDDSPVGQVSNFLMARIALAQDDKRTAQTAFKQAIKFNYDNSITQECEFNYLKLSAESGNVRGAINGLKNIERTHHFFDDCQDLLSALLLRSEDYLTSMAVIEGMPERNKALNNTYKVITYRYGIQNLNDDHLLQANTYLELSQKTPGDKDLTASAMFWRGYILKIQGKRDQAVAMLEDYIGSGHRGHLVECYYTLGYQALEIGQYKKAINHFNALEKEFRSDKEKMKFYSDAMLRQGDCHLYLNNYDKAYSAYDKALKVQANESDYALYQKAIIEGLRGDIVSKVSILEDLLNDHTSSQFTDDAHFNLGEAYFIMGKNNLAARHFDTVIDKYGALSEYTVRASLMKGLISYNQGDMIQALENYERVFDLNPSGDQKKEALLAIEEIFLKEYEDPAGYFSFIKNKTGLDVDDLARDSISFAIGFDQFKRGEFAQAIRAFDKYLDNFLKGDNRYKALYYKGEAASILKEYDLALKSYATIVEEKPSEFFTPALRKAALISFNYKQDFDQAFRFFNQLVKNSEGLNDLDILESALYSAYIIKNEKGIEKYAVLVSDHQDVSSIQKGTAYFYLGKSQMRQEKYDDAIAQFNKVIRFSNNNQAAEASYLVSEIFYLKNDLVTAETQALSTTKTAAAYPFWVAKSILLIGRIYYDKEDYLNAQAACEAVLENFKTNDELTKEAEQLLSKIQEKMSKENRIKEDAEHTIFEQDTIQK